MGDGGTNHSENMATADRATGGTGPATGGEGGPRELSRPAAVVVTVLAAVFASAVVLAVFHWLGWTVPGVGWIVAKAGIKLAVGGFAGLAVAATWLRARLRSRPGR